MKLLITGHDAAGKAVFSHVGEPPRELHPGSYELWATRGPLSVPDATDPMSPPAIGYFPAAGESSFKIVTVPPSVGRGSEVPSAQGEISEFFDADDPEMHETHTVDYVIVLAGEAELELDDGCRERVIAGDCVVQRGTRHAWRVRGSDPLVLGAVLIGARRENA